MNRTVTIAGQEFELRYTNPCRRLVESERKKGLWECFTSGILDDQIAVIWAGISSVTRRRKGSSYVSDRSIEDVFDLIEQHRSEGGEYLPVLKACGWAAFEALIFGAEISAIQVRTCFGPDPMKQEEAEGKAEPTTVVAAS